MCIDDTRNSQRMKECRFSRVLILSTIAFEHNNTEGYCVTYHFVFVPYSGS